MRKIKIISVLFVILVFSYSETSFSQGFGRGMGRGMCWWGAGYPNPNYPNLLNLTQDQISRINETQTKFQSENIALINNLQQKNLEFQNLMMTQPVDQTAVNFKIDEINKIQAELQKKVLGQTEEIRNIMTDQQKTLINSYNLGYGWALMPYGSPYGQGLGLGTASGYNARFGPGMGYGRYGGGGYYGGNVIGGARLGRGPCGMGLGRSGGWGRWW